MKFQIKDCEIITGTNPTGKFILQVEHKPTGKLVRREHSSPLTETDRVAALQELSDLIEGRKTSERQLLVEGS